MGAGGIRCRLGAAFLHLARLGPAPCVIAFTCAASSSTTKPAHRSRREAPGSCRRESTQRHGDTDPPETLSAEVVARLLG